MFVLEKYSSGLRGLPAKEVVRVNDSWVQIPSSPPFFKLFMTTKIKSSISRIIIIILLSLSITGLLVPVFIFYPVIGVILLFSYYFINLICFLIVLNYKRSDIQSKISWSILLLFLPGAGALLYYVGGYAPIRRKRSLKKISNLENGLFKISDSDKELFKNYHPLFKENFVYQQKPITIGNQIRSLNNGGETFKQIIKDLEKADKFINLQYFIINDGIIWKKIEAILIKKHKEGVKVRVAVDWIGCIQTKNKTFRGLKKSGIDFIQFNKPPLLFWNGALNWRNHNKFLIIDNKVAYFGGLNIGDDYASLYAKYGIWFDLQFKVQGPIVDQINKQFIIEWKKATHKDISDDATMNIKHLKNANWEDPIQLFNDGPQYNETTFLNNLISLIKNSKKSISIITPYVIIPNKLELALEDAINRGVEIRLITIGRADKKIAYNIGKLYVERLVERGVKVFRMENAFIHSRIFVFDDKLSIVGTSNLDYRAIYLHFETNFLVESISFNDKLTKIFNSYIENCYIENIQESNWGFFKIFCWKIAKILSPIL